MKNKKQYDDDDGRTIADMSGVERPALFTFRPPHDKPDVTGNKTPLSKDETRGVILGALGAALLIGGVFIAAGALFIWFLTTVWR